ncbi:hypothetical protein SK128_022548, partial [Halocaridina rubra]
VTRSDEGKEEDMRGASNEVDVIEGTQVRVLEGLVDDLSVIEGSSSLQTYPQDSESPQGATGGVHLQESARVLSAFRRPRE